MLKAESKGSSPSHATLSSTIWLLYVRPDVKYMSRLRQYIMAEVSKFAARGRETLYPGRLAQKMAFPPTA